MPTLKISRIPQNFADRNLLFSGEAAEVGVLLAVAVLCSAAEKTGSCVLHHLAELHLASELEGALCSLERGDEFDFLLDGHGLFAGDDEIQECLQQVGVKVRQVRRDAAPALLAVEIDLVARAHGFPFADDEDDIAIPAETDARNVCAGLADVDGAHGSLAEHGAGHRERVDAVIDEVIAAGDGGEMHLAELRQFVAQFDNVRHEALAGRPKAASEVGPSRTRS